METDAAEAAVEAAVEAIRRGQMVVLVGSEEPQAEGSLVMAAELCTPEAVVFMVTEARGIVALALPAERCDELDLPEVRTNRTQPSAAFTVTIEARRGVTTGISAADRAHTIRIASDPATRAEDLVRPGHILPLRARSGGVLERAGRTEAGVDLARLAGLRPAGVVCGILAEDGEMATGDALRSFAAERELAVVTVPGLRTYRRRRERWIDAIGTRTLRTESGAVEVTAFRETYGHTEHLAVSSGDARRPDVRVFVHVECLAGDVLGSRECDCAEQLRRDLLAVAGSPPAVLVYLRRSNSGLGHLVGGRAACALRTDEAVGSLERSLLADEVCRALGAPDGAARA